jgi:hypothetical protein
MLSLYSVFCLRIGIDTITSAEIAEETGCGRQFIDGVAQI